MIAPASRAIRHTSSTGSTTPVGEVMWLIETTRAPASSSPAIASTTPSALVTGAGSAQGTNVAPLRSQTYCQSRSTAPYSWSVLRTRSPSRSFSERATMFIPTVAFGTSARVSVAQPTYAASAAVAPSSSSGPRRSSSSTGSRSSSSCQAWNASMTGCGQAPNDPWLRKVTDGSSRNSRFNDRASVIAPRYRSR